MDGKFQEDAINTVTTENRKDSSEKAGTMMVTKHNTCTSTTGDEEGCKKKEFVDVQKENGKEEKPSSSNFVEGSITVREEQLQTNEQKEQQQQPLHNHIVKFTDQNVREYERVIDTSVNMHMSLSLGWAYIDKPSKAIISEEDIEVFNNRDDTSRKDDDNVVDDDDDEYKYVDDDENSSSSLTRGGSEVRAQKKLPHERYLIFLRYGYTREQLKDASLETKQRAKQERLEEIHKQQLKAIVDDYRVQVRQVEMTRKTRRSRTPPPKSIQQYPCRSSCSGIRGKPLWK